MLIITQFSRKHFQGESNSLAVENLPIFESLFEPEHFFVACFVNEDFLLAAEIFQDFRFLEIVFELVLSEVVGA